MDGGTGPTSRSPRPRDGRTMAIDALDRLADVAVPPVPARQAFAAGVRRKINPRLLVTHVLEFAVGAMAWGLVHMAVALLAAARYTVTGTWPETRDTSQPGDGR